MISHTLTLDYTLAPGWLAPFIDGLEHGVAVGRKCNDCAAVSFPPLRICTCGSDTGTWLTLSGKAEIGLHTSGTDGSFGMVRFEGADTHATVALIDIKSDDCTGWIMASDGNLPMMRITRISNA